MTAVYFWTLHTDRLAGDSVPWPMIVWMKEKGIACVEIRRERVRERMRTDSHFKPWWDESLRLHALICVLPLTNAHWGDYASASMQRPPLPSPAYQQPGSLQGPKDWAQHFWAFVCVYLWGRWFRMCTYPLWFIETALKPLRVSSLP